MLVCNKQGLPGAISTQRVVNLLGLHDLTDRPFVVIGASSSLGSVIDFSDAMIFAMVFPNVIGLLILAPKVKDEIQRYLEAIKEIRGK